MLHSNSFIKSNNGFLWRFCKLTYKTSLSSPGKRPVISLKKDIGYWLNYRRSWIPRSNIQNIGEQLLYHVTFNLDESAVFSPGIVNVQSSCGRSLGVALLNETSAVALRLLHCDQHVSLSKAFFIARIAKSLAWREEMFQDPFYRLVNGDGDGLPGIFIDRFQDVLSIQITCSGWDDYVFTLIETLKELLDPRVIILRRDHATRKLEKLSLLPPEIVHGSLEPDKKIEALEGGLSFKFDILGGYNSLYEGRDARAVGLQYVRGKRVLDLHASYLGIQALACHAAESVVAVGGGVEGLHEAAKAAMVENKYNLIETKNQWELLSKWQKDAFESGDRGMFDVVLLQPPPNKHVSDPTRALKALEHTLRESIGVIKQRGGIIHLVWTHASQPPLEDVLNVANLAAAAAFKNSGESQKLNLNLISQGGGGAVDFLWPADIPRLGSNPWYTWRVDIQL